VKDFVHLRDQRAEWMRDAACRDQPDYDFFPESMTSPDAARAVTLCNRCPVQDRCARYAMVNEIEYGIWGGLSPRARREIVASRSPRKRERENLTYQTYQRFKQQNRNDPVKATARELRISTATVYHHIRLVKFRLIYQSLTEQDRPGDVDTDRAENNSQPR
jgi:hypothetical protein